MTFSGPNEKCKFSRKWKANHSSVYVNLCAMSCTHFNNTLLFLEQTSSCHAVCPLPRFNIYTRWPVFTKLRINLTPIETTRTIILKFSSIRNDNIMTSEFVKQVRTPAQSNFVLKWCMTTPWRPVGLWDVEAPVFSGQSAHRWRRGCQPYAPAGRPPFTPQMIPGTHFG
jgi:hypothetical protein